MHVYQTKIKLHETDAAGANITLAGTLIYSELIGAGRNNYATAPGGGFR